MPTPPVANPENPSLESRLPFGRKFAWGVGGFAENLANTAILSLAYPIYNVTLGLSPVLIGWALSISRIFDALTDPIMGSITDGTRSRWGRRRPWIAAGALVMAVFFALVWFVGPHWSPHAMFAYLAILSCLFYLGFTMFVIPYSGLGLELAEGYEERTRLMTFRLVPSFVASLITWWLFRLTQHSVFPNAAVGARYVGLGIAALIFVTAIAPAIWCRERFAQQAADHMGLWRSVRLACANRPYRMVVGSAFFVFFGLFFTIPLTTYLNIYYVAGGDKVFGADISGYAGTAITVMQFAAMPLIGWLGKFYEKRTLVLGGLALAIVGFVSSWWLCTPAHPFLFIVPQVLYQFGLCFCWVINGSFVADICDADELAHGARREGMFSAVFALIYKCAVGIVALLSGYLISWAGFDKVGEVHDPALLLRLRVTFVLTPLVFFGLAMLCLVRYPLGRQRVAEIQAQLRTRRMPVKATP